MYVYTHTQTRIVIYIYIYITYVYIYICIHISIYIQSSAWRWKQLLDLMNAEQELSEAIGPASKFVYQAGKRYYATRRSTEGYNKVFIRSGRIAAQLHPKKIARDLRAHCERGTSKPHKCFTPFRDKAKAITRWRKCFYSLPGRDRERRITSMFYNCLLYTSDAADE